MSKSKIILLIAFIILVIGAVLGGLALQKQTVSFKVSTPVYLLSGDAKIATIEKEREINLRDGEYCTIAVDTRYSQEKQCFMVFKQKKEVLIEADYSKEELASKLSSELNAIKDVVNTRYSNIINQYTVCQGELLTDGNWYAGVLRDKIGTLSDNGNYYYFLMQKNENWEIKTTPSVVISKHMAESENIPERIIDYANTIQPCEAEVTSPENIPLNNVNRFEAKQPIYTY